MDRSLWTEVELGEGTAVVRLHGKGGVMEAQALREPLDELLSRDVQRVYLDVDELDYVTAHAVEAIVKGYAKTHEKGRVLILPPDRSGRPTRAEHRQTVVNSYAG